jgi:predicted ferric reductase
MTRSSLARALPFLLLYTALALLPLAMAAIDGPRHRREFVVEFGVGLGFVALAVLGLQFALTARFPRLAAPFGLDRLVQFHRLMGILAAILVAAHVLLLIVARRQFLHFLDPTTSLTRAAALWAVLAALALLLGSTLLRRQLRLPYQWWRLVHGVLALFVLAVATVHLFRVGHYSGEAWKMATWAVLAASAGGLLGWARVVRPLRQLRRPYEVVAVRPERGRAWTVVLRPRGHPGLRFEAGQFAWLALDQPPYDIDSHPFSFASSAEQPHELAFTIKALGDFTSRVGSIRPGALAYVDGPYGNFTLDPRAAGAVFITGGVGITPAVSILRTMRDRGDTRPAWLVAAARAPDSIVLFEAIEELRAAGNLHVCYVVEEPPAGWDGEAGYLTRELLDRRLPPAATPGLHYFVCGPGPMMDIVERALLARGVPRIAIRSERFNIA